MSKVYGIHPLELNPGVQPEEFERFVAEELYPAVQLAGIGSSILKGDRGARAGKYLALFEFESVERRNWAFPQPGQISAEYQQAIAPYAQVVEKLYSFVSGIGDPTSHTDYISIGR